VRGDLWGCYVCCCGDHGVVSVSCGRDLELFAFVFVLVGIVIPLFFSCDISFLGYIQANFGTYL